MAEGTTLCQQMDGTTDKRWEGHFPWSSQAKQLLQVLRNFLINAEHGTTKP